MSVKDDYQKLQEEIEEMQIRSSNIEKLLEQYKKSHADFVKKKEEFSQRTSPLAKNLLKEVCEEIRQIEKRIEEGEEESDKIKEALKDCEIRREELENNPAEYIEEQTDFLTMKFMQFVSEIEYKLGMKIKTWFDICHANNNCEDKGSTFCCPTGIIEIKWEKGLITKSEDYYFKNLLYKKTYNQDNGMVIVNETEWFKYYLQLFYKVLRTKIEEAFKEHPNFKIIFTDDTQFILELR